MKTYIGVNNLSKEAKKIYIGYNNKAVELPIFTPPVTTRVMTAKFNLSDSNPATWGSYEDDAAGMVAGSADWDTFFGHYPCILENGVELGKLNPNNMAQYEDGTSAPITTLGKDVMICFPRRGLKIWQDGGYLYVSMTDEDNADGYSYLAHSYKGNPLSAFYLGKYKGYVSNNMLYSTSGQKPRSNYTIGTFRTYAQARGTGYEQSAFFQLTYRQAMYMLKYLGQNAQTVVGKGFGNYKSAVYGATGYTNDKGMDWGESTGSFPMTLFGLEDFYGNISEWIDGIRSNSSYQLLAADGNYNNTGSGYTAITDKTSASNYMGFLKTVLGTNAGGFAPDVTTVDNYGSATTYYCDYAFVYPEKIADFGGDYGSPADNNGVFRLYLANDPSVTGTARGSRLMFMKP